MCGDTLPFEPAPCFLTATAKVELMVQPAITSATNIITLRLHAKPSNFDSFKSGH